jgi:hypothetical protein
MDGQMKETLFDRVTTGIAAGSLASPFWLPWLKTVSDVAALLLPIFGLVWLVVQIATRLLRKG